MDGQNVPMGPPIPMGPPLEGGVMPINQPPPPQPPTPPAPPQPPIPGGPVGEKPVDKPLEGNNPPIVNNPGQPAGGGAVPGTPGQPKPATPPTGINVGPDGKPIDPSLDANGNPLPPGQNPGVPGAPGQPKPATPPTGINVGPDGKPIDPSLDANGNPLPPGQPNGQGPVGPAPGTPGGPPLGPPPGLSKEKFDAFAQAPTVDDLLSKLAGESLEEIGATISLEQVEAILAKYGTDPKFLAFIQSGGKPPGTPGTPGQPKPPTGSNVGPDGKPIDPSLDANGNPLPPGQPDGQGPVGPAPGTPGGPPLGPPPGLAKEKFDDLANFTKVDDLINKLANEDLATIGASINPEQTEAILSKLSPAEQQQLVDFINRGGKPGGSPGQPNPPKPGTPPTGSNVGPDGKPIDPSLDANGNPLPPGQPNGQGPAPGTPGGPPLGPPPGLPKEKFDAFAQAPTVDELISKLAGEDLASIGASITPEQAQVILEKFGNDPKFLAFIQSGGKPPAGPGGPNPAGPPTGSNVGPDGKPIDPSLDANGNPLPPGQQGGQPPGPPRKPPGLPQEKFESLRVFNSVDDLIAKLEGENLEEIGNNISDEQGSEIFAALTPEEFVRLSKFIEEKTGIPLDPDPPDVVSPDPSAESVQVVGSVTDVAGS